MKMADTDCDRIRHNGTERENHFHSTGWSLGGEYMRSKILKLIQDPELRKKIEEIQNE